MEILKSRNAYKIKGVWVESGKVVVEHLAFDVGEVVTLEEKLEFRHA